MRTVVLALTILIAAAALAETNSVSTLPTVVVYATRIEDAASDIPSSVRVIEADEIADSGAADLGGLLERKANVQVRTVNSNPMQSQIAMRGFGENSFGRVKVVVDGETLNSVDMDPPDLSRISLDGISRIEVIRSPSPVLYGDGAVAGVINVITDSRDYRKRTRLTVRGGSEATFGASARTRGGFEEEGLLYAASGSYLRSDGYRDRSGCDLYSAHGGLRKNFANGSYVGFGANYSNSLYEMPGALTRDEWRRDRRQPAYWNDWCRQWNYGFALDSKLRLADDQWLYLDAVFSVKHRRTNWGDWGYANEYDLYGYQVSPRYVNENVIFDFDNKFTLGFDFRYDRYEVKDNSGYNNGNYAFNRGRPAVFAQDEFFVSDEFSVLAGARCEYIDNCWKNYRGLVNPTSYDVMGDYELGIAYRPVEGTKTFLKGTYFHRSAFCDELSYTEDGDFLRPETGASLDAGIESVIAEEFTFELSGYWMVMEDEIFYNPHAKEYYPGVYGGYNCNSPGTTDRLGFDTSVGWRRDKVAEVSLSESFVEAHFLNGPYAGKDVPMVPQSRTRLEAGYWIFDDLEVKAGFRYVTTQVLAGDFDNAHERLAGYPLFDLALVYRPFWAEGWQATFVMDNLLDRNYCDFAGWSDYTGAYFYPAAGRTFRFVLSYEF